MNAERLTHSQHWDRPGDGNDCASGRHNYVFEGDGDSGDEDFEPSLAVCTRCGASDVEPE